MKKTKKALASLAIAGMTLSMIPFNAFAADTVNTRLAGNTAVQTSQAIAQDGWTTSANAVIAPATAYNMVDALAAAPLAAALKAPVLLTGGDQLSAEAKTEITRLGVKTVYATSGLAVIKAGVIADLQGMGVTVVNLGGYDQYETSVNIAKQIAKITPTTSIFIANGESARVAQDALSVAAIAGAQGQPLLLTKQGQLPTAVANYIDSIKANVANSYITGGTGVVSSAVEAQLPGKVFRNAGYDAYDTNLAVLKNFTTLDYTRVFVANGETMIDALAGAPLAAATKSPVVLVNGSVKTATTDFLKDKVTTSTVVTALGGAAVVPENLRTTIAKPDQLNVTDIAGTTSSIYLDDDDPTLGFTVGGVEKTVSEMESAGYTVEFQATKAIFYGEEYESSDGVVDMNADDVSTAGDSFNYKVILTKGETVVSSPSKKVTVKNGDTGTGAIESVKIYLADDEDTVKDGESVQVESNTLTVDDDAYIRVKGSDANDEPNVITTDAKYSSSDPSIAYVDKTNGVIGDEYAPIVLGGATGTATITVTTSDGYKKTLSLKVVDEDRKASSSKTEIDKPSKIKLGGESTTLAFGVTVNDQFGDPIKGYTIDPKDAISSSDTIGEAVAVTYDEENDNPIYEPSNYDTDADQPTDYKGRVLVVVKGGEDDGTATLTVKDDDSNTLGSVSVSNRASSGTAVDYELRMAPFRVDTLDASDDIDNVTLFNIDAYDSSGYKTAMPTDEKFTIKIDGDKNDGDDTNKYVTVDDSTIDDGYIKVTAKKVKSSSITIALYQGDSSIKLDSATVKVEDTRTQVTGATFESSVPTIYSMSGIKLDRVLDESGIKTDNGNPVTFTLDDSDSSVLIKDVDGTVIGNLKLSVLDGDLSPEFQENDSDIMIAFDSGDTDQIGESGTIRLTVNKLTGEEDANGIPANATSVATKNIEVEDLVD